jgi:glutathione S-transferase
LASSHSNRYFALAIVQLCFLSCSVAKHRLGCMTLQLLVGPLCNFSAKVRFALAEKAIAFELVEVPFSLEAGQMPKHPSVLSISPKAETPVLLDDTLQLYDSTVLLEYLEDRYPTPPLYPSGAAQRARCRLLEAQADELIWPSVAELSSAAKLADASRVAAAREILERYYCRFDGELATRQYLCEQFSVADIGLFAHLDFARQLGYPIQSECPVLLAWFERVSARPAVRMVRQQLAQSLHRVMQAARVTGP